MERSSTEMKRKGGERLLACEGYRMFRGTATIKPKNPQFESFDVHGTWLYNPDHDCWYVNGHSYPAGIVCDIKDDEA